MCKRVHIVTKEVADGTKSLPVQVLFSPQVAVMGVGSFAWSPRTWPKGLASAKRLIPVPKKWRFISWFCEHLATVPARTVFSHSHSKPALSKPRKLLPLRLCDRASNVISMSSNARWSWMRRACSAITTCTAQEDEVSSTTNADAVNCENMEGGCQNNTTFPVEYSRVASKFEEGEPSEGMVEAHCSPVGHWVADEDRGAGLTVTGGGALSRVGETSPEVALSAPIDSGSSGARGSEPGLLDERSESSARRRADTPVTLAEGCRVTTGLTGSVGIACSTSAAKVRRG